MSDVKQQKRLLESKLPNIINHYILEPFEKKEFVIV